MPMNLDEALDTIAAKFCNQCGDPLDPPGSQCAGCGALPGTTRPELEDFLTAEPGSVARVEADQLREEAQRMLDQAEVMFRRADAVLHADALSRVCAVTQGKLEAALGERKQAAARAEDAAVAEQALRKPLAEAYQHRQDAAQAEETARRMRHGAQAETDALVRLNATAEVLKRYQDDAHEAAQGARAAEEVLAAADARVEACELDRDQAAADLTRCAPVPLTRETLFALGRPLLRMAGGRDVGNAPLARDERAMAGVFGRGIDAMAFREFAAALDKDEAQEAEAALMERLMTGPHMTQVGDGMLSAAWIRPPAVPRTPGGQVTPAPQVSPAGPFSVSPGLHARPSAG